MLFLVCCLLFAASIPFVVAASFPLRSPGQQSVSSPYLPTAGWTYAVEAIRSSPWPDCPYRFLSFPDSCGSVDLWRGVGSNQMWTLESASSLDPSVFYLRASCGSYLRCSLFSISYILHDLICPFTCSYPSECGVDKVSLMKLIESMGSTPFEKALG
jgi:hypothetical protein